MRIWYIVCALLTGFPSLGQFDLPVKEQYDHMAHKQLHGTYSGVVAYMVDNPSANPWSGYRYGEQVGYFLEGYLRMYETTRDKAYLIRFINLAVEAMAWRNSDFFFTGESVGDAEAPYMNGVLLWPMAHFVHLVLAEENDLAMDVIPDGLIAYQTSTVAVNVLPYSSSHTYASIATWFMYRCVESLDALLAVHWSTESAFCHGEKICAVNLQAGFGGAMLYLGHLGNVNSSYSGLLSYLDKGAILAAMFSGDEPDDRCNCIEGSPVLIPFANNSYWWHHKALSYERRPCPYICWGNVGWANNEADMDGHHEFVEDISHGVIDLVMPNLSNRFGLYTNGAYPFTEDDLVRFRNAFANNIAYWNSSRWSFNSAVNGNDGPVYCNTNDLPCFSNAGYPPDDHWQFAALGWMPLHSFDDAPGATGGADVYDIVSQFYSTEVFTTPVVISGGLYHYGVAEVVSAQWEHECFSFKLFNRELVYDQNFAAKAVLTVDAFGEAGASFSDPVITEPRFTVKDGISSTFRAGEAVVWEPGFEAELGSMVEMSIDPLGCGMGYRSASGGWSDAANRTEPQRERARFIVTTEATEVSRAARAEEVLEVKLVPNPSSGEFKLITPVQIGHVSVFDPQGREVLRTRERTIDLTGHAPGLYTAVVTTEQGRQAVRLVLVSP